MIQYIKSHPVLFALFFSVLAFIPIMALRDFSPSNEMRYLIIADEAIANHKFFAFTLLGEAYADKPPFYFWCVILCRLIFSKHCMFALSLFSMIPAVVIAVIMDKWMLLSSSGKDSTPIRRAAMAFMLFTSVMFLSLTFFLRMDMMMVMFIVLSMFSFWKIYQNVGNVKVQSYLLPIWIFMALFTKGPVGVMMPPLAIFVFLAYQKELKSVGKYLGWKTWLVLLIPTLLWFLFAWIDGGNSYMQNLLFHQTVDRGVNAFHHKQPIWYYCLAIWYELAPWCLLVIPMFVMSFVRKTDDSVERLWACSALSCFVMLSLFSSKLAIYLLPILPFMIYVFPLVQKRVAYNKWMKAALVIPEVIFLILGIAALAFSTGKLWGLLPDMEIEPYMFVTDWTIRIAALIVIVGSAYSLRRTINDSSWEKSVILLSATFLTMLFVASFSLPKANPLFGYKALCDDIQLAMSETGADSVNTIYVHRSENMRLFLGYDVKNYNKDANQLLKDNPDGLLVISTDRIERNQDLKALLDTKQYSKSGLYRIYNLGQ